MKRAIQNRVDRIFDRKRYDYRQTLIDFGRGLGTETNLEQLLQSITARLSQSLLVARVGVFVASEQEPGMFRLGASHGLPSTVAEGGEPLALGFLDFDRAGAGTHVFLDNPQQALHLTLAQRQTAALLELHYYLPCRAQHRTIAIIGLGRTTGGDFLSSELSCSSRSPATWA